MRRILQVAVCGLCLTVAPSRADLIYHIRGAGDSPVAVVTPGSVLNLLTRVDATAGEQILALEYTVEFETQNWTLLSRSYLVQGWDVNVNTTPAQGAAATFITNGLYGGTPTTPDILFNRARTVAVGSGVIEQFSFLVPSLPLGTYQIDFGDHAAWGYGAGGVSLASSQAHGFTVNVVPEPGALGLLGLALAGAAGCRRRRA